MADEVHVHNTPPAGDGGGGGMSVALVVVVLVLVGLIAWFVFARGGGEVADEATEVNIETPDIDVPDQIDVNVEQK